jgi:hypothetical protein
MRQGFSRRFITCLLAGAVVSSVTLVRGGDGESSGAAPRAAPRFKPGDTLTIAAPSANVMRGAEVIATVAQGQRILVVEVRDAWIGALVSENGQNRAGWINCDAFLPGDAPRAPVAADQCSGPRVYTVARPILDESGQTTLAALPAPAVGIIVSPPPPAPARWDDYLIGYYGRHETDPDVHAWEPWRRR